ncbi:hypothetical protein PAAG_05301 [Paracoccidioides lutzii Pb01]|uniref:Uncharacterized protein n=1 Tax=Paracoccidioides lutzii (strain ATCC MYA-826 / Pb01) TaxID=502779 RepID=C1H3F8_PARBA|nr:hypothetical protein PAAG_05301 [Paracoccidioides lutzii Pb01]EEH34252.1 hypothetical protein PAAG_05301 [Paracoccidioides lutzii Pb01]
MYADNIYVGSIIDQDRPSPSQWWPVATIRPLLGYDAGEPMLSRVSNRQNSSDNQKWGESPPQQQRLRPAFGDV